MENRFCHGRECKLGWGYNKSLDHLIPIEGEPPNIISEEKYKWWYFPHTLSADNIMYWKFINLFLESSYKKDNDFRIIFDDNEYWEVHCYFRRRRDRCDKFQQYPLICSHFVKRIEYGVDLRIQFLKAEFPAEEINIKTLLTERQLNEAQKKSRCRILINYNEIKEITMEELVEFMKELDQGKHSQYNIQSEFSTDQVVPEFRETTINNQDEFGKFLSYLYYIYRKIEMKMEKNQHPHIRPDTESGEESFVNICSNLKNAKEEYKLMDKDDFLKMYPVLKNLFFCYIDYIKYSIVHTNDMDEGDHLPGTVDEIKKWLRELNVWFPMEVNEKWMNFTDFFIGTTQGFNEIIRILHETIKFKEACVINDNEAVELYIGDEKNKKTVFGLVDMKRAEKTEIPHDAIVYRSQCPDECTKDLRKWICTACGDFVSIKVNEIGQLLLFCFCGSKIYRDKLLSCHYPSHRLSQASKKQDELEISHPPVPDTRERKYQLPVFDLSTT